MIKTFDKRRTIALPGDEEKTIQFAVDHWIKTAQKAIASKGSFFVALSGGSTPKKIFSHFTPSMLDWSSVYLFWSDERSVLPTDPESNYKMALDSGLGKLPIPKAQIFRMHAEKDIEENALLYEKKIKEIVPNASFDLIMLGMGEDGHTASLFPETKALREKDRLVVANSVPSKQTTRMTFTFPLINKAQEIVIYVLGKGKQDALENIFTNPSSSLPATQVGSVLHPALWIIDDAAGLLLLHN